MSHFMAHLAAALQGRYRIERELGEGGMATVYLADDLKHERKVAVKVLKPELAAVVGAERFLAEIKTTANLQHPHILPLFDSGEAEGFLFYVMPYVEGESLRDRLDRERQLPVDAATRIATNVAEALDYAHGRGIVHRDIKPANVLLLEGKPVLADFGIALAVGQAGGGRLTETGLSMGTPHYMSPEQASGDTNVGPRADIYALGCVLYEMLVGDPPHMGSTPQAVLGRIITGSPDPVTEHRKTVPAHLDAAVSKALEKVPADRFASAGAFAEALTDPTFRYSPSGAPSPTTAGARSWGRIAAGSTATAVVLALLAAWGWLRPTGANDAGPATRAEVGGLPFIDTGRGLAISPDGRWLAATGLLNRGPSLFLRASDGVEWREVADGASNPSFSPDSEWLVFETTEAEIRKIPVRGGAAVTLADDASLPHWGTQDTIVFVHPSGGEILKVGAEGGDPEVIFDSDTLLARTAHWLPGGEAIAFGTHTFGDPLDGRVLVHDRRNDRVREIVSSGVDPRYVRTGHILFGQGDQTLDAVPFDLGNLAATGPPVNVVPELKVAPLGVALYGVSDGGTLLYDAEPIRSSPPARMVEVDRNGREQSLPSEPTGVFFIPRYSPDGSRIAFEEERERQTEIRILNRETGANLQFTTGGGSIPVWSADGETIYYTSRDSAGRSARVGHRRPADFSREATRLFAHDRDTFFSDVSADETWAVLYVLGEGRGELERLSLEEEGQTVEDMIAGDAREAHGALSPDGRWIAYVSDESGEFRVYATTFPDPSGRRAVSPGYAVDPVWGPDGTELFYRVGTEFYVVDVSTEPSFTMSAPRLLFDRPEFLERVGDLFRNWDLHPGGDRFVMMEGLADVTEPANLHIVTSWFEELRERTGGR